MEILKGLRPEAAGFSPYSAGLSIEEIRERLGLADVVKLASNENPLGMSQVVLEAICRAAPSAFRYPRPGNPALVEALAAKFGLDPESIVVGNGSDELIDLLIRVKARPGVDNIVAFKPSFSIYELQARLGGVEFRTTPLGEDFSFDWDGFVGLSDEHTTIAFATSPDNPSGLTATADELCAVAKRLPKGCLFVVDEAYIDFAPAGSSPLKRLASLGNTAILRTFSKAYGLAGLRLGWLTGPPAVVDYVRRVRLPFSVNAIAEAAGLAALEDDFFHARTVETTLVGRDLLTRSLVELGFRVWPSGANFLMTRPESGAAAGWTAEQVVEQLLNVGLIVRSLKSYGLPGLFRISVGNPEENHKLLAALGDLLKRRQP